MNLQGSFIIDERKIWNFIPNKMIVETKSLKIMVNEGKSVWVLTLKNGEQWYYKPFSHELCKAERIRFGRIYLGRFTRYLRDEYTHKSCLKKVFSVYFCTQKNMFLMKEVKEYWPLGLEKDPDPKIRELAGGYSAVTRWFEAFPSSPEAEELNKDEPY